MNTIGLIIERSGIKISDISLKTNISENLISRIMNGSTDPTFEMIQNLMDAIGYKLIFVDKNINSIDYDIRPIPKKFPHPETNGEYSKYFKSSIKRGLAFDLTPNEFFNIKAQPCTYCKIDGKMGIDRINSKLGYIKDNVQPCCTVCNLMKRALSHEAFLEHINRIAKNSCN